MVEQEVFKLVPGHQLVRTRRGIPKRGGVYAIFVRDGDLALKAMGSTEHFGRRHWSVEDFTHVYTGSTHSLRRRLKNHLLGDARVSSFRSSLMAAELTYGAIRATGHDLPIAPNLDTALTLWLSIHALFGFQARDDFVDHERECLDLFASPLNIVGRKSEPTAVQLRKIRRECADEYHKKHDVAHWHLPCVNRRRLGCEVNKQVNE